MSKEILINITPQETRVAILENGMLHELYIERSRSRGLVGNVYKGKVVRVLPGMEAAFVELVWKKPLFYTSRMLRIKIKKPAMVKLFKLVMC